jgi:hypothetical protein
MSCGIQPHTCPPAGVTRKSTAAACGLAPLLRRTSRIWPVYSEPRRQDMGSDAQILMAPREEPVQISPHAVRQIADTAPALCAYAEKEVQSRTQQMQPNQAEKCTFILHLHVIMRA